MNKSNGMPRGLRIAYVICEDVNQETGVLKKIAAQMHYWITKGHEAKLFVAAQSKECWSGLSDLNVEITLTQKFSDKMNRNLLLEKILPWKPDMLYLRFSWPYPFINRIVSEFPSIMEINSDDYAEIKSYLLKQKQYIRFIYYLFSRNRFYSRLSGFVFLSNELKIYFSRYKKLGVVISNGIDIDKISPSQAPNNNSPRLFFMGTPGQSWHGIDKICVIAKHYPTWQFELVGVTASEVVAPPTNMHFHGHLNNEKYSDILSKSDVAIATLALHRKNMNEASPLKVREYLAHGLPTILGYKDTDFPDGAPFLLQLPNAPTNVEDSLDTIEKFTLARMGKRVERSEILHIHLGEKENQRISFFKKFLGIVN
jgi:glycosyltransferase involved in cell wall biosynthesis